MLAAQASALLSARITNRALQKAQESMRLAMDTQTEMLARLDADVRIGYANSAFAKHLGLAQLSLLGRRVSDFLPECKRAKVIEHFEEIRRDKEARTTDQTMVGDDGRVHTHRWTDSPVFNDRNEIVGFQSWGWDISDLCDREAALKSAHAGLLSTNKELTARNAEILQLTYALTHDLQTPLATLTGQLTLLDQALRTGFSSEKPMSRMRSTVDRLTHMLTDLMAYARAGQEQTRREPVNLGSLVKNLVDEIAPIAAANGVLLSFDQHGCADASSRPSDLVVIGDRDALHRSICNLISNATKYTAAKPRGDKHVRVRLMQNDERVRLCIIDTGLGIPPAMLEEVFLPFKRISRDSQGTGLGLSIVKKYIELFGGKVWLESDGHNGTTAVVEFKRQAQSALAA
jgi:PAS domain S-box-containing protein